MAAVDDALLPRPLTGKVLTSDGIQLVYDIHNPQGRSTVVLIHGWSGSRRYWKLNAREIASAGHRVVLYDQRFHGDSDRPKHGHSVARLAADLKTLLEKLEIRRACCVGASMGAAVLWSYQELFGTAADDRIGSIVTVDQAPLQNIVPGWRLGSTGCYDGYTLGVLHSALRADFAKFAQDNAAFCCDTNNIKPEVLDMLAVETMKADQEGLCKLMADHTANDCEAVDVVGAWPQLVPHSNARPCAHRRARYSSHDHRPLLELCRESEQRVPLGGYGGRVEDADGFCARADRVLGLQPLALPGRSGLVQSCRGRIRDATLVRGSGTGRVFRAERGWLLCSEVAP